MPKPKEPSRFEEVYLDPMPGSREVIVAGASVWSVGSFVIGSIAERWPVIAAGMASAVIGAAAAAQGFASIKRASYREGYDAAQSDTLAQLPIHDDVFPETEAQADTLWLGHAISRQR